MPLGRGRWVSEFWDSQNSTVRPFLKKKKKKKRRSKTGTEKWKEILKT
jgi:hypothetical protein